MFVKIIQVSADEGMDFFNLPCVISVKCPQETRARKKIRRKRGRGERGGNGTYPTPRFFSFFLLEQERLSLARGGLE